MSSNVDSYWNFSDGQILEGSVEDFADSNEGKLCFSLEIISFGSNNFGNYQLTLNHFMRGSKTINCKVVQPSTPSSSERSVTTNRSGMLEYDGI